jgi:hypothetical protein
VVARALRVVAVSAALLSMMGAAACSSPKIEPLVLQGNMLAVNNTTDESWSDVAIWVNRYFRAIVPSIPAHSRADLTLDSFISGYGQRFDRHRIQLTDLKLTAKRPDGKPLELKYDFEKAGLAAVMEKMGKKP